MDFLIWEKKFENKMMEIFEKDLDPAHDVLHVKRVVSFAKMLSKHENAKLEVVLPSAWLHDFVNIPKNDPRRKEASKLSAIEAINFLKEIQYPAEHLNDIYHAIETHSYSAEIEAETIEAKIVQDADRLDSLGSIGIARCFIVAGKMSRSIYNANDPFCIERQINDNLYTIDHFCRKILKLADGMNTEIAKQEARKRHKVIVEFLNQLKDEISSTVS